MTEVQECAKDQSALSVLTQTVLASATILFITDAVASKRVRAVSDRYMKGVPSALIICGVFVILQEMSILVTTTPLLNNALVYLKSTKGKTKQDRERIAMATKRATVARKMLFRTSVFSLTSIAFTLYTCLSLRVTGK